MFRFFVVVWMGIGFTTPAFGDHNEALSSESLSVPSRSERHPEPDFASDQFSVHRPGLREAAFLWQDLSMESKVIVAGVFLGFFIAASRIVEAMFPQCFAGMSFRF